MKVAVAAVVVAGRMIHYFFNYASLLLSVLFRYIFKRRGNWRDGRLLCCVFLKNECTDCTSLYTEIIRKTI
jgi:hypothetical protein